MMILEFINPRIKTLFILVCTGLLIVLTWYFRAIIIEFAVAYIISYIFEPLVRKIEKKTGRILAVIIIWVLMITILFSIVFPAVLSLMREASEIQPKISGYADSMKKTLGNLGKSQSGLVSDFMDYVNVTWEDLYAFFFSKVRSFFEVLVEWSRKSAISLVSGFMWTVTVPIISFYMMLDFTGISSYVAGTFIFRNRKVKKIFIEIEHEISRFFRGQLLICTVIGFMMGFGFYLAGIDFPHLLGIIAGISNLVPYLGVIVSTSLALVFALLKFGVTGAFLASTLKIFILVAVVQSVDGFFLSPRIIGSSLNLSPVVVMFFLMAGGTAGGIPGMFFAIPVLIIVKVLILNIRFEFGRQ